MEVQYVCSVCSKRVDIASNQYKCDCGGLFWLEYERKPLNFEKIQKEGNHSLWRYIEAMPFVKGDSVIETLTMGEGMTPLFPLNPKEKNLLAKADFYMPTLSFKDRGAAVLIAMAKKLGMTKVVADSSGNAGTAIAAYAARGGIACAVYVPEATSDKKLKQIQAHGAKVHRISGSREDTAKAAIADVESNPVFYASHIFNPLFYEGTQTYFYEVFEQLGLKMPDAFIIPTGNGTLLLGAHLAFQRLLKWGLIDHAPTIISVQAERCAPIQKAFDSGASTVAAVENEGTLAEGIAIAAPARGAHILQALRENKGRMLSVSEEEIQDARDEMAGFGVYVEITSAANYAAYKKLLQQEPSYKNKKVVLPLCGAGLKN